ncbi:hypothetical protein ACP70R_047902 [Stipagrostis hirtigluma subsp. patula]
MAAYTKDCSPRQLTAENYQTLSLLADLEIGKWVEVKNLDDGQALFVSRGCSKAVPMTG